MEEYRLSHDREHQLLAEAQLQRFTALERSIEAAFTASQTAIDKAEAQLAQWKITSNEVREQLAAQANTFATIEGMRGLEQRLEALLIGLRRDLDELKLKASAIQGRDTQQSEGSETSRQSTGLLLTAIGVAISASVAAAGLIVALGK